MGGNFQERNFNFNTQNNSLNHLTLLISYSVKDKEPIAFTIQARNIKEVPAIKNAIKEVKLFNEDNPLVVTKNGQLNTNNIIEFLSNKIKFLTLVDTKVDWVTSTLDKVKDKVTFAGSICPFNPTLRGLTTTIEHDCLIKTPSEIKSSTSLNFEAKLEKLYVHVFYSSNDAIAKKTALNNQLQELKSFLVDGIEDFTLITKEKIQWLFILKKSSKTGKIKVEFNEEAIDIESKCFVFLS